MIFYNTAIIGSDTEAGQFIKINGNVTYIKNCYLDNISSINIANNTTTTIENLHVVNTRGISTEISGVINIYDSSTAYIKNINLSGNINDAAGQRYGNSTYGVYVYNNSTIILDGVIRIVNFQYTLLYANNSSNIKVIGAAGTSKDIFLGDSSVNSLISCKEIAIYINNNSSFFSDCSLSNIIYGTILIDNNSSMNTENISYTFNSSTLNTTLIGIKILNFSTLKCNNLTTVFGSSSSFLISNNSYAFCSILTISGIATSDVLSIVNNSYFAVINTLTINVSKNGIYIDNSILFARIIELNNISNIGLYMVSGSELINSTSLTINNTCSQGIYINNSKIQSGAITLNNPTVNGLEMINNSKLFMSGLFKISVTCNTGISINNSEMTTAGITLNSATTTGLLLINSKLINSGAFTISTGESVTGISIDNSEMTSLSITLNNPTTNGLLMTNNGILINTNYFTITTGTCAGDSISITNSEMKSGSIILSNTLSTTAIKIDNAKMTVPTISIVNATTGLIINNNGILINLTSFSITGTCTTGIQIDNSEMASTAITFATLTTGVKMTNNGILNNSGAFQITGTCTTGIEMIDSHMESASISLNNATTGLNLTVSKLITVGAFTITGTNANGISMINSEMILQSITLKNPTTNGLVMNDSKLLILGDFKISQGICDTCIKITNSEMTLNKSTSLIQLFTTSATCIQMDNSKMNVPNIALNNITQRGLYMLNNSLLINSGQFRTHGSTSLPIIGIDINNSEMIGGDIRLTGASQNCLLISNNGKLITPGAFIIDGNICDTSISITNSEMSSNSIELKNTSTTVAIKIDNAKMTVPTISIDVAVSGVNLINNGVLINLTSFAITNRCETGIQINNSEMASTAIKLTTSTTTGLLMTNNGILNNSG